MFVSKHLMTMTPTIHLIRDLKEAFQALPLHIALEVASSSAILLIFCATRNMFVLRLLPCVIEAEIMRIVLIWIIFFCSKPEFEFLADFHLLIAGRIKKEAYKTLHGSDSRHRRRLETYFLGIVNQFHGLTFNYAENYLNNISREAKLKREKNTEEFLRALRKGQSFAHGFKGDLEAKLFNESVKGGRL